METEILLRENVIDSSIENPFSYKIWESVIDLPKNWDDLVANQDLFLSSSYCSVLEKFAPEGLKHYFIGFYDDRQLIGVSLFQVAIIKASDAYRPIYPKEKSPLLFIEKFLKSELPKLFEFKVLVGGNLMLTGEHSYYFDNNRISKQRAFELWHEAILNFKQEGIKPKLTLLKDFFDDDRSINYDKIIEDKNHPFNVEPNMILHIDKRWDTLEDYSSILVKKYRARLKTAKKKSKDIVKKSLALSEIIKLNSSIFKLYESVSNRASFNTFILNEDYFIEMKRSLKDNFRLIGYFLDDKLIGFFTVILTKNNVETHFLGYCPILNKGHQLYLNMLYDMVEIGIYEKKEDVIYARTALEIKSTIGAEPYHMKLFMKHENPILNKLTETIFNYVKPKNEWVQRHPFKGN